MGSFEWKEVRKWTGVLISLPLSVICGFDLAFTVYAVPLKEHFNYTQTQVEVIASAGIIGFGFSVVQPSLVKLCGVTLTYVISGSAGTGGLWLLWLACAKRDIFKNMFLLVTIFQLVACSGIAIAAAMTASTTVSHFDLSSSGKIVAVYAAMYALGKVFFIYLLELAFEEDDNLGGFFVTSGICFLVLMVFSAVFHRPKPVKKSEELSLVTKGNDHLEARNTQTIVPLKHIINSLKGSSLFHLTFWPAVLIYSCSVTIMNNLTTIVPEEHTKPSTIVTVFSVANAVVRILVGMVMDTSGFVSVRRKLYLKVGFSAFFLAVMTMYAIGIDIDDLSVPFAIGSGMSVGALFVIPVAMLTYTFGKAYYSFTFGLFLGTAAICVLIIQVIAGLIYDDCEDGFLKYPIKENCFFWPFILIINIAAVTICAIIGNIYYQSTRPTRTTDGFPQESDIDGTHKRSGYISFEDGTETEGSDTGKHVGTSDALMANGTGKHNGSTTLPIGTVSRIGDASGAVTENSSLKSKGRVPGANSNSSMNQKIVSGRSVLDNGDKGKGDNRDNSKNNFSNVALD